MSNTNYAENSPGIVFALPATTTEEFHMDRGPNVDHVANRSAALWVAGWVFLSNRTESNHDEGGTRVAVPTTTGR